MNANVLVSSLSRASFGLVIPLSPEARQRARQRASTAGLVLFMAILLGIGVEHQAYAYLGQGVITFAKNYIVAPLGLLSLLVALGASIINPMFVKSAIYTTLVCAAMFVIMANASDLINAVSSN